MNTNVRKHWFITGVSSGLGLALAKAAWDRGDRVTGTVRSDAARAHVLGGAPDHADIRLLDIADTQGVHRTVAAVEAERGPIDILVNNAGYALFGALEEASPEEIRRQFDVNVFGTIAVIRAVLPFMRARRRGRLITISSVSGLVGWGGMAVYSASKFALEGLCESLAQEVAPLGIDVTLAEPGGLRTDFAARSLTETAEKISDYDATSGANLRILRGHGGEEAGDPAKAAQAILRIADAQKPPLRLLLGKDALGYVRRKEGQFAVEMDAWMTLTQGIGFEDSAQTA